MPERITKIRRKPTSIKHITHQSKQDRHRFYCSTEWKSFRKRQLKSQPTCERCEVLTPATQVHHIVDLARDWTRRLDPTNTECLCHSCHSKITRDRQESKWRSEETKSAHADHKRNTRSVAWSQHHHQEKKLTLSMWTSLVWWLNTDVDHDRKDWLYFCFRTIGHLACLHALETRGQQMKIAKRQPTLSEQFNHLTIKHLQFENMQIDFAETRERIIQDPQCSDQLRSHLKMIKKSDDDVIKIYFDIVSWIQRSPLWCRFNAR